MGVSLVGPTGERGKQGVATKRQDRKENENTTTHKKKTSRKQEVPLVPFVLQVKRNANNSRQSNIIKINKLTHDAQEDNVRMHTV